MPNNLRETCQYLTTGIRDFYLDIYDPRVVPSGEFDKIVTIPPGFDKRPDLLSYQEYGTAGLWWVFAVRNPDELIDPIEDFRAGMDIYIPRNILRT